MNHKVRQAIRQYLFEPSREPIRRSDRAWMTGEPGAKRENREHERAVALRQARAAA